jgi:hypothetical protein
LIAVAGETPVGDEREDLMSSPEPGTHLAGPHVRVGR